MMFPWPGIPLRRLELCGCRVGAQGAQRLAEALRNPQGAGRGAITGHFTGGTRENGE